MRMREDGSVSAAQVGRIGVVLIILVALTFIASPYHLFQLTMVVSYACAVLGLTILTGINGQISLGHGAFFAIGSYTAAILMANYNWPYWATLPIAAITSAVLGFIIGFPALRLGGLYLALTTFALAVAVPQILKVNALEDLTGGVQGLTTDKPDAPFGLPISSDQWIYLFTLGVGALVFLLGWNWHAGDWAARCGRCETMRPRPRRWVSIWRRSKPGPSPSVRCSPASPVGCRPSPCSSSRLIVSASRCRSRCLSG